MPDRATRRLPVGAWVAAAASTSLLLAMSPRYGFHRDEFYFLTTGRRLDWGYVDQPPLTAVVARLAEDVGGVSPTALRVIPALAVGGTVLLASSMARRFGGGTIAQVFAACAVAGSGVLLGEGHLLSTAVLDFAIWTAALWVVVAILDGASPRWWIALGAIFGIGLQNKHTMAFLAVALVVGMLIADRSVLRGRWPWIGAAIAAVIWLPDLWWQAQNDSPQFEMAAALRDGGDGPVAFLLLQPALLSLVFAVPATIGLWWLLRSPAGRPWRSVGIAYVVLLILFLVSGGKPYYVAPMYSALLAAGSLWFESLPTRGRVAAGVAASIGVAIGVLITLPVLPEPSAGTLDATGELVETVGWPDLVDQVEAVHLSLPEDSRADATIFTASYGEAGAIDVLGGDRDLPVAHSGHNNYWLWGPPERHGAIIGVGPVDGALGLVCADLRQVDVISNRSGVENEEAGLPLWLCETPDRQLADVWDDVKHYN